MAIYTQLNKASTFSFELVFPVIPVQTELRANEELILNVFETVIPGLTLDISEQRWMGGKINLASGEMTFEPWNTNFVVDSDFKNWQVLYKWITYINNNDDVFIRSHTEYTTDATLRIINNFRKQVLTIFFVDIWPNSLGEVSLSYREGEQNIESQVSFVYDRYEIREYSDI